MEELLMVGAAALAGIAAFVVLRKRVDGDCPP
jgi:LPXTG-motif cell wall-anchored protein